MKSPMERISLYGITDTLATVEKEIKTFNLEGRIDEVTDLLLKYRTNAPQIIKDNIGTHFNEIHGNKISMSTFIAAIKMYLDNKDHK